MARSVKGASTEIFGMSRRTGLDRGRCLPAGCPAACRGGGADAETGAARGGTGASDVDSS